MKKNYVFKNYAILAFIISLGFPLHLFSQDLTGMWTGKVYTTDKTLPYEVAISEKDGKLSGFSYTTFTVKGEEMVAVKSIVVRKEKDNIIIEDADLVFNSFDEESPKQLKQTNTLVLSNAGSTMLLTGKFKTLKTKEFRSLTGGIRLRKDSIIEQPRLIAKLEEMDLSKSLSFLPQKEEPVVAVAKVVTEIEKPRQEETAITTPTVKAAAPTTKRISPTAIKPSAPPVAAAKPVVPPRPQPTAAVVKKPAPAAIPPVATKPVPPPVTTAAVAKTTTRAAAGSFVSNLGNRTIETIQTVAFKSDSITLTLYDNGDVDGDTVSILLNGKTILARQGLSTNAITKTIYMTPDLGDSLQLIMFAENLGSLPPNTGLLIIKDGRDRYEIRFAGDLTKNAAITLRRKPVN